MTRQNNTQKNITKYRNGYYSIQHYEYNKRKENITTKKWTRLLTQHNNNAVMLYVLKIIITISQRKGNYFDLSM